MNTYIAFYINSGKDYKRSKASIEETLKIHFENTVSFYTEEYIKRIDNENSIITSKVIVYTLRKPVIKDNDHFALFFRNLEKCFIVLDEYSPHFTQNHDALEGGYLPQKKSQNSSTGVSNL